MVRAAKQVANIEAMGRLIREHWEDVEAGPTDPFTPEEIEMSEELAKSFIKAAFSDEHD